MMEYITKGQRLMLGGGVIIGLDVWGVAMTGLTALLTPLPYSVAYNGLGMIFAGLDGWGINMPDLPLIPYP